MSSEVKLIVQNNVTIDSEGNFKLSFAENGYNGKQELFLSAEDEFFFLKVSWLILIQGIKTRQIISRRIMK